MPALMPLELLLILLMLYVAFRVFCWALNSKKLDNVIEEVAHPDVHSLDGAAQRLEDAGLLASKTLAETEAEIEKKRAKAERLRKAYGG